MSDSLQPTPLYCANHPDVETGLRCKRCDKPICAKCAIATPTGYICKQCEGQQQKIFETALPRDFAFALIISLILSGIGSAIALLLGWYVILIAPVAGVAVAEAVRAATQRRRSEKLFRTVVAGVIAGALPLAITTFITFNLWTIATIGFFIFTTALTAYHRLKGINIR